MPIRSPETNETALPLALVLDAGAAGRTPPDTSTASSGTGGSSSVQPVHPARKTTEKSSARIIRVNNHVL